MIDERCAPRPPLSTIANGPLDRYLVLTMGTYPVRGVFVDVPLSVLGRTASVAAVAMQAIDFSTRPAYPVKSIAECCRRWRFWSSFERRRPCDSGAVRPSRGRFRRPWRWRLGSIRSRRRWRGGRSRFWWSLVLRTVRPCIPPAPIVSPLAIAGRALQCMGGDLGLAVVAPPCVKEAFPRRRAPCLWSTVAAGRRGRWRLL